MMVHVPNVLSKAQVKNLRLSLDSAEWIDGNETSGPQAALAKKNLQMPGESAKARQAGEMVLEALKTKFPVLRRRVATENFPALVQSL